MFDPKSDYALNKLDQESIVCPSTTGVHIRLTREDFDSEDEFLRWKAWSDSDYKGIENTGRSYYDHCIALTEALKSTDTSVEDVFFVPLMRAEQKEQQIAMVQKIKKVLTKKQYRRLWMFYVDGKTVREIAALENITPRAVNLCLANAVKAIVNKL